MHYAPPRNWMNDPNGLVHHDGRYHLYYQYNPYAPVHDDMSWGHASSTDLVTWEDHPVALWCSEQEEVYSGSVVVDAEGVSGYGGPDSPALLAFYTAHQRGARRQTQCVAYSLDGGLTWTRHADNPVLDRGSADFRDPKVLRWQRPDGSAFWIMVAVEATSGPDPEQAPASTMMRPCLASRRPSRSTPVFSSICAGWRNSAAVSSSALVDITRTGRRAPTGSTSPSCTARSNFTCAAGGNSPISSRNSVPPSASANLPM